MEMKLVRVANTVLDLEPLKEISPIVEANPEPALLKLDANECTVGPSPAVYEAIESFLHNRPLNWSPNSEADRLKEGLARYVSLPKEAISCFEDSSAADICIARTYLESGTGVVISGPSRDSFKIAAKSTGANVCEVVHDNPADPQIEAIINQIGPRTRLVYIPNPNDISGAMFSEAEIVFLLAYAEGCMVVVNEEHFEYCGLTVADLIMRFPNLIVKRSFAKAFGLGSLPTAYILTDSENLEFINRMKISGNPDAFHQVAATAALEDVTNMRRNMTELNRSRKILYESLPEIGYEFQITPANFFLLKVPDTESATAFLAREGVLVRALSSNDQLEGYLRVTIGTTEQTDRLLMVLSKLAEKMATGYNRHSFIRAIEQRVPDSRKTLTAMQTSS
jgi:histidinol-phosphate aminotransferase